MITKEEFYYNSRDKVTKIHAVKWIPEGEIKAVLQIAHGMNEYIERYDKFATYMAEQGFLVVGNDHLGHGKSIQSEDDYGYFCHKDADVVVVRDMHRLKKRIQGENLTKPYFILGHSMGSFFTRKYLTMYSNGIEGAILCGTGNRKMIDVNLGTAVSKIITIFKGERYRSSLIRNTSFKGYNDRYAKVRTQNDWLTRDEAIVDKYNNDNRCTFTFTCNAYYYFFKILKYLQKDENLEKMSKELPIYIISGLEDPVGGYGKEVEFVFNKFKDIGMKDVSMKLYPNDRHEILNELDKETVFKDIHEWITEKTQIIQEDMG